MKIFMLALILISSLSTCKERRHEKSGEKTDDTLTSETISEEKIALVAEESSRLVVSFFSRGSGIDRELMNSFSSHLTEAHSDLSFTKVKWGREGEIEFCFPLTELTEEKQAEFIKAVHNFCKDSQLVRIYENRVCREARIGE